jgi:hypothetical protein
MWPAHFWAQSSFEEKVDHAFGIDQSLVNGVQFSNQYILIEGNPYFLNEGYRVGSVCINQQWIDYVPMRYNLYSQKVEIQYLSREGNLNQLITVPERMSAFLLEGYEFQRMQIGEDDPSYFMVLTASRTSCYIKWSREAMGGGSSQRRFGPLNRRYWIQDGDFYIFFKDRRSYVRAFPPERKREFRKLLKGSKFYFQMATAREVEDFISATLRLYEKGLQP